MTTPPLIYDDFLNAGTPETRSPFITENSRSWGSELTLKGAFLSAGLLLTAFILSYTQTFEPISHVLLICVYFFAGVPSLIETIEDLGEFNINIDMLMTLAAFSSLFIGSGYEGGLLLVLFAISGAMEDAVTLRAKSALTHLHQIAPTKASVVEGDEVRLGSFDRVIERAIRDIPVGAKILIRPGEIVPLDGIVLDGTSSVNLGHLTGEHVPVTRTLGQDLPAGGRNLDGALLIRVTRTSNDSTLSQMIQLVTQAQDAKPKLQRWFDRLSQRYATSIILLAVIFTVTFPWLLNIPFLGQAGSLYRSLAFLIAASPCALIIALPIAYLSALSACARRGILLKGGTILDALAQCRYAAFDKTGTLTTGNLTCLGLESPAVLSDTDKKEILAMARALERSAVHPIARSLVAYTDAMDLPTIAFSDFKMIPGYGLEGIIEDHAVYLGHPEYVADRIHEAHKQLLATRIQELRNEGELISLMLYKGIPTLFRFQDTIRGNVNDTLIQLNQLGIKSIMLTGDHQESAKRVADQLQIDSYYYDLKPEEKLMQVTQLANQGLMMVGDGMNDAPALARATVGISMGKVGSSAAMDAADIILLHDSIEKVGWLVLKAHQTKHIVFQNLMIATAAIIGASLPALGGLVPLWLAVILHEGGTILVGLNALRLLRK